MALSKLCPQPKFGVIWANMNEFIKLVLKHRYDIEMELRE